MLKFLLVDFNLLDGSEKNIFPLRTTAKIFECCKIRSNCKKQQQNKLRSDCRTYRTNSICRCRNEIYLCVMFAQFKQINYSGLSQDLSARIPSVW